ncbi:hypothetical protein [Rubinisphaera sp.]|uniref:hypothetical protein n=1 Tax=Rubinisphaera sp. TaxID=2024857 RepID=UPI0025D5F305|nr:hypothetical protein [Rubinisphaera sp.]|tara:strand:+ start:20331 stop:22049 length:1719 start_codon:yes stop_codon:yes gene_type:complete
MRKMCRLSLACLSLLIFTTTIRAAEGPDLLPDSTAAVIKLMAPQKTLKQLSSFADSVQEGSGGMIKGQAGMLGLGISNPTMQGVDQSRDWWAGVFLNEDDDPAVVFVIPAIDTEAMGEALDESFTFVAHEKYGIYSDNDAAMELVQAHLEDRTSKSVASLASEQIKSQFEGSHIAVAVNLVLVKEVYADKLEEMREQMNEGMKEAQGQMLEVPGMNLDFLKDLTEKIADKIVVIVEDAEGYSNALTVTDAGINFKEVVEFTDGSRSAKYLAANPPQPATQLSKLPSEQLFYWNAGGNMNKINEWGLSLLPKMLDMSEEDAAEWKKLSAMTKKVNYEGMSGAFSLGDLQTGLVRTIALGTASPASQFRDAMAKAVELMDGMEISGMTQELSLEKNYEKVDGVDVDLMLTKQTMDNDPQFGGFQAQINQFMYGGDTIETRVAFVDDTHYLQTMGGGKELMETAVKAYKNQSADTDAVVSRDIKPLGENNFVLLMDIPTLVKQGLSIAANAPNLPPMPFDQDSLENLEIQRSYIGVSVATKDRACIGQLYIPVETFQAGASLMQFFQQIQGGNAF